MPGIPDRAITEVTALRKMEVMVPAAVVAQPADLPVTEKTPRALRADPEQMVEELVAPEAQRRPRGQMERSPAAVVAVPETPTLQLPRPVTVPMAR
jgi:hypothetical protein